MASETELKRRWVDKEDLISQIIECLRNQDETWPNLIKNLEFVEEIENRRDLRGISLANQDLKGISFKNTTLRYTDFTDTDLEGVVFNHVDLRDSTLIGAKLGNADLQAADLRGSRLKDIQVDEDTDWGTHFLGQKEKRKEVQSTPKFILTQYIFRYLGYKGKIYSEHLSKTKEDYRATKQIYRALRIAYQDIDSVTSDYFAYREYHCELVLIPWWHPARWLEFLWEKISCFGTSPVRLSLFILLLIIIWAFIYSIYPEGIVRNTVQGDVPISGFGEAFYFSVITFTSLGYGDFHPNHDSVVGSYLKYCCCAEVLVGIVFLALFIAVWVRFVSK